MATRPNQTGTASALTLGALMSTARDEGVDVDALLRELDVAPAALHDVEHRIPEAVRLRAWREVEERTKDPFLGLHVAEHAHVGMFDVLDYAVYVSATFDQSLENICRFHRLICDAWGFRRTIDGAVTRIQRVTLTPRHEAECFFALLLWRERQLTGADLAPREVRFAHPAPADVSYHAKVFRCPVRFACPVNEISLPSEHLALPVKTSNPGLEGVLARYMRELIARLPKDDSFIERVRAVVARSMRVGPPSLQATARALKSSPRTVQRRLGLLGTRHSDVVDSVRREMAVQLVDHGRLSITEIAFLLGFSEVSGFRRAYKRWTGVPPTRGRAGRDPGSPRATA